MKKRIFLLFSIMIIATGCSTVNQSVNQAGTSAIQLEPEVKVGEKIEGSSNTVFLLGFLDLYNLPGSNKKYIDGVNVGGSSPSIKLGPLSIPNPFDKTGKLKSAALYDAINKSGADLIVNPQYVVTVGNMLLFKTYNVNISGYKGTIKGFKGDNLVD